MSNPEKIRPTTPKRNPYIVLGIEPPGTTQQKRSIYDPRLGFSEYHEGNAAYRKNDAIVETLKKNTEGRISLLDQVSYQEITFKLQKSRSKEDNGTPLERHLREKEIQHFEDHLNMEKERIILQQTINELKETHEKALQESIHAIKVFLGEKITAPKMEIDISPPLSENESAETKHDITITRFLPSISELTEELHELIKKLRKKENHSQQINSYVEKLLSNAQKTLQNAWDQVEKVKNNPLEKTTITPLEVLQHELDICTQNIAGKKEITFFDVLLKKRMKELSDQHHPDKNPNDKDAETRFIEIQRAYNHLSNTSYDEKMKLAADAAFGQDTGAWTDEMRKTGWPFTKIFSPMLISEPPLQKDEELCSTCSGHGSITLQDEDDYFPVPRICATCDGEGTIPSKAIEDTQEQTRQKVIRLTKKEK